MPQPPAPSPGHTVAHLPGEAARPAARQSSERV
jgi:hypothetical protein